MKRVLKTALIVVVLSIFAVQPISAQCVGCPPPAPPAHGPGNSTGGVETPGGGCAPIDGGTTMLVLMGVTYAAYKSRKILLLK